MSVKVAFRETIGAAPAASRTLTVPQNAVQQENGRDVVLIVQDGRATRRVVTVRSSSGGETVIGGGLAAGEKVAVDWPKDLADGTAVVEKLGLGK